ncbi:hypothetical protein DXG01_007310 [Tephrocybe rancida]|nr:hypothetical protein DXG01_007310 [Tephrocybe rancida]
MHLFDGVRYFLSTSLPEERVNELSHVLDSNGAIRINSIDDEGLTHFITNSNSFERWQAVATREEEGKLSVVTDKWVDKSLLLGKLQHPSHYSANPAMIFSGVVACAAELEATDLEVLSAGITALGGQWRTGLTKDVTHLFVTNPTSRKYSTALHFRQDTDIKIILPHWFDDAVRLGIRLQTTSYEWPDPPMLLAQGAEDGEGAKADAIKRAALRKLDHEKKTLYRTAELLDPNAPLPNGDEGTSQSSVASPREKTKNVWDSRRVLLGRSLELSGSRRDAVEAEIRRAGGKIVPHEGGKDEEMAVVDECDVFVTRFRSGRAYAQRPQVVRQAVRQAKTIGTLPWVFHVHSIGTLSPPMDQLLWYPIPKRPIEGFSGHEITVTNYTGESREYIKKLIVAMGAKFTPSMSGKNTVLIAAYVSGTKTTKAASWSIPIVNHTWLEDCFVKWRNLTVALEKYIVFPPGVDFSRQLGDRGVGREVEDVGEDELELLEQEDDEEETLAVELEAEAKDASKGKEKEKTKEVSGSAYPLSTPGSAQDAQEVEDVVAVDGDGDVHMDVDMGLPDMHFDAEEPNRAAADEERDHPMEQEEEEEEELEPAKPTPTPRPTKSITERMQEKGESTAKTRIKKGKPKAPPASGSTTPVHVPKRKSGQVEVEVEVSPTKKRPRSSSDSDVEVVSAPVKKASKLVRRTTGGEGEGSNSNSWLVNASASTPVRLKTPAQESEGEEEEEEAPGKPHRGVLKKSPSKQVLSEEESAEEEAVVKSRKKLPKKKNVFIDDKVDEGNEEAIIVGAKKGKRKAQSDEEEEEEEEQPTKAKGRKNAAASSSISKAAKEKKRLPSPESDDDYDIVIVSTSKATPKTKTTEAGRPRPRPISKNKKAEAPEPEEEEEPSPPPKKAAPKLRASFPKSKKVATPPASDEESEPSPKKSSAKLRASTSKSKKVSPPPSSDEEEPSSKKASVKSRASTSKLKKVAAPPASDEEEVSPSKRVSKKSRASTSKSNKISISSGSEEEDEPSTPKKVAKPRPVTYKSRKSDAPPVSDDDERPSTSKKPPPKPRASMSKPKKAATPPLSDESDLTPPPVSSVKKATAKPSHSTTQTTKKGNDGSTSYDEEEEDEPPQRSRTKSTIKSGAADVSSAPKRTVSVLLPGLFLSTKEPPRVKSAVPNGLSRTESIRVAANERASTSRKATASSSTSKAKPKAKPAPAPAPAASVSSSPPANEDDGDSSVIVTGRARRGAAARATQKLHEEIMPDVMNYQQEMRSVGKGRRSLGSLPAASGSGKKRQSTGGGSDDEDDPREAKRRKLSGKGKAPASEDEEDEVEEVSRPAKGKGKQVDDDEGGAAKIAKAKKAKADDLNSSVGSKPSSVRLMTTQVPLDDDVIKALLKLGVKMTIKPSECTHLLAPHLVRTEKFLCALATAPFILTAKWAIESAAAKKLLDERNYLLRDKTNEKKFDFVLADALARAKELRGTLFSKMAFYITPKVQINHSLLKNVITACGGQVNNFLFRAIADMLMDGRELVS